VIVGERDGYAFPAKNGAGVAAVGNDEFVRRDDGNDSSGSDDIVVGSLELAPAREGLVALAPAINLVVHASESILHC